MKNNITVLICFLSLSITPIFTQNSIEKVLKIIENNNKLLKAKSYEFKATQAGFKTGKTLSTPTVEYDLLVGNQNAGIQHDLLIAQELDFSIVSGKQKYYANAQAIQLDTLFLAERQEILLQTKNLCLEYIYWLKKQQLVNERLLMTKHLFKQYEKGLEIGSVNILDLNKVKIQLLNISTKTTGIDRKLWMVKLQIEEKNGGEPIDLSALKYDKTSEVGSFESIYEKAEIKDYDLKVLEMQTDINSAKKAMTKSMKLPKIELGYRYQTFLNQEFNGAHIQVAIPLWEQKNKLNQIQAAEFQNELELDHYHSMHKAELQSKYDRYLQLTNTVSVYEKTLATIDSERLLNKALELGQISTVDYFNEMNFLYESKLALMSLEKDMYLLKAYLQRFSL
jgi:cobalt-zinc-cadmium efflux system outer membrane protein